MHSPKPYLIYLISIVAGISTGPLSARAESPNLLQQVVGDYVQRSDMASGISSALGGPSAPKASLEELEGKAKDAYSKIGDHFRNLSEGLPCANEFRGEEGARNKPNAKAMGLLKKYQDEIVKNWSGVVAELAQVRSFKLPQSSEATVPFCAKGAPGVSVMGQYEAAVTSGTNFFYLRSEAIGKLAYEIGPYYREGDPGVKNDNYLRDRFQKEFDRPRRAPACKPGYDERLKAAVDSVQKYATAVGEIKRSYTDPMVNYLSGQRNVARDRLEDCRSFEKKSQ